MNLAQARRIWSWLPLAALMVVLPVAAGCQFRRSFGFKTSYYYTQTADGKTLALRRYQPDELYAGRDPVILCHGLNYNLMFWDLADEVSLARFLAENGYDVWSLSLRGATPSSRPVTSAMRRMTRFNLEPHMLAAIQHRVTNVRMLNWNVDDHIRYDLPAAIAFVAQETQHEQVHWVGHSMGGMVMFAYLSQDDPAAVNQVRSFVAVAVPMTVFHPLSQPMNFLLSAEVPLGVGSAVVGSSAPALVNLIVAGIDDDLNRLFFNARNMRDHVKREMFRVAQEDISAGQFSQLLGMVRTERFRSHDGAVDYTARLGHVRTPVCFLVGTVDNMATPDAVRYAYRSVASEQKTFHMYGRVNGHREDYGHNDIIIGEHSRAEVYPTILQWLQQHPVRTEDMAFPLQPCEIAPDNETAAAPLTE